MLFDDHGFVYGGENKVDSVFGILFCGVGGEFLAGVEISSRAGHHHIAHAAFQGEGERAVGTGHLFLVGAVVAHDAYHGVGHGFLVAVEYPSGYENLQVGQFEGIEVVVAAVVAAVGAEKAALAGAESYAEVIGGGIHRGTHVCHLPATRWC